MKSGVRKYVFHNPERVECCNSFKFNPLRVEKGNSIYPGFHPGLFMFDHFVVTVAVSLPLPSGFTPVFYNSLNDHSGLFTFKLSQAFS
jgi:hypothetical protein